MLFSDLYQHILESPVRNDVSINRLCVVSGYSTSAMAFRHLRSVPGFKLELICGMTVSEGLNWSNHQGFWKLVNQDFQERFSCRYVCKGKPVHSKIYIWCKNTVPRIAFLGSANYSQSAMLFGKTREAMIECSATDAYGYFEALLEDSVACSHPKAEEMVSPQGDKRKVTDANLGFTANLDFSGLQYVTISLLAKNGTLPQRSGLNWGQRPEHDRETNQAYIRLPVQVYESDFFPPRGVFFTVHTDDRFTFIGSRAQEGGKAIHTPHDNGIIGRYFRKRLGLSGGVPVSFQNLANYGRTDIVFYKIDDETYYLDFGV